MLVGSSKPQQHLSLSVVQDKDAVKLHKTYGGVEGLASALHVDISEGLSPAAAGDTSIESRQAAFGANRWGIL